MATYQCQLGMQTKQQANLILNEVKIGIPHPVHIINQALTVTGDLNGQQLQNNKLQDNIRSIQDDGVWSLHRETSGENVYKG